MSFPDEFCQAWRSGGPFGDLLTRFVSATGSRASGLWWMERQELVLAGFGSASDMPEEVREGFQAATARVPLDQTGLGIVKAIVAGQPAIAHRDAGQTGLSGSATWIEKFGANSSLAVPIRSVDSNRFAGVLAVSTATTVAPNDSVWRIITSICTRLSINRPCSARR